MLLDHIPLNTLFHLPLPPVKLLLFPTSLLPTFFVCKCRVACSSRGGWEVILGGKGNLPVATPLRNVFPSPVTVNCPLGPSSGWCHGPSPVCDGMLMVQSLAGLVHLHFPLILFFLLEIVLPSFLFHERVCVVMCSSGREFLKTNYALQVIPYSLSVSLFWLNTHCSPTKWTLKKWCKQTLFCFLDEATRSSSYCQESSWRLPQSE